MASPLTAAGAYANIARIATDASSGLGLGAGIPGKSDGSFAAMLKDAVGAVSEAGRKSDAQTQALATGKSNMVDVVTAVAETEVAVQAMVAVRDKVISAYEEIMKMPI
jgi:flagellar hook-basal body complex protein FliE